MVEHVLVSLGSNVGDRRAHLAHAVARLVALPEVESYAVSPLFETEAHGGPRGQGNFLNASLKMTVDGLAPSRLLEVMLAVEGERRRRRSVRNGPRTLDLDILLFGDRAVREPGLEIPHPRMHERPFVLAPAAAVAGELVHPVLRVTVAAMAESVGEQGLIAVLDEPSWSETALGSR